MEIQLIEQLLAKLNPEIKRKKYTLDEREVVIGKFQYDALVDMTTKYLNKLKEEENK